MALDALSASTMSTGAPVLDNPVLAQNHNLLYTGLTLPAPALDGPAISVDPSTIWPFPINWRSSVTVEFEFKTDVWASRDETEQRRADRDQPRKKWDYKFSVAGDAFREKIAQVTFRFGEVFLFANPMYRAEIASDFDALDPSFSMATVPGWISEGVFLLLVYGAQTRPVRVIDVSGTDVAIAGVNDVLWSAAGTRVYLAEPIHIAEDSLKVMAQTASVAEGTATLDVRPEAVLYFGGGVAGDTYNGREIFLKKPNWSQSVGLDLSSGRATVDYGQGRNALFSPVPFVIRDLRCTFLSRDLDEIEDVIGFFCRMKGRRGEFYFPSQTNDLVPVVPLLSGGSTLRTDGLANFVAFNSPNLTDSTPILKAVIVFLADGTYLCRGIDSVTQASGDSVFNLDDTWPADIPLSSIKRISYLPVCRFGADALSIELLTNSVGQFNLPIRALRAQDPE